MAKEDRVSCGKDYTSCSDINATLDEACRAGFDFVCIPLMNPRFKREFLAGPAKNRGGAVTRSDMLLPSQDWSSLVVAKISPWIDMDSKHDAVRKNSSYALKQELMFASHLGVPAVMVPIHGAECFNLARVLNAYVLQGHNHQFWVRVPMQAPEDQCDDIFEEGQGEGRLPAKGDTWKHDTWKWWNTLRTMCNTSKRISLALELTADMPASHVMDQWCGEPIKAALIPTSIFLTNRKGFPVLSRVHQSFIFQLFKLDVQMVITGANRHTDKGIKSYQQYVEHLYQSQPPPDNIAKFAKGYEDYLQCPLQPLMDNLESQTYEVFERDPVKYSQYQKAIYQALLDRVPAEDKDKTVILVMVLGAGRGPLVTASLNAADKAGRRIRVYAVEKNPNAVVTLEGLKHEVWGDLVTVVSSDMRHWEAPEKADIIVSELLGSFGDNELSPECLDGAQKFLKDDGISIPRSYTSYIAPLSSSKLWNETRAAKEQHKHPEAPFETPYVVRLHNINILDKTKPLFTFEHPNRGIIDNSRYDSVTFDIESDTVLHGFGGYFDCQLYADVDLSIVPETHSPGMFSWFPIFFPIKDPMLLSRGDKLKVNFWRVCSSKNVWYEWCVTAPQVQAILNPKGRSYTIGL